MTVKSLLLHVCNDAVHVFIGFFVGCLKLGHIAISGHQGSRIRNIHVFYLFEGYISTLAYSISAYINNNRICCSYNTVV